MGGGALGRCYTPRVSRARPLFFVLFLFSAAAAAYAAWQGQALLLAGATVFLAVIGLSLGGPWPWVALTLGALAVVGALWEMRENLTPAQGVGGLLLLLGLTWARLRERTNTRELAWQSQVVQAFTRGSERLSQARDGQAIIQAGVSLLSQLGVAPTLAFVAYQQGLPYIVAAAGDYAPFVDRPVRQDASGGHSVQADHWVDEQVLALLSRGRRQATHVAQVYGRDETHLGLLVLARPTSEHFSASEKEVISSCARLLGAQLGQQHANRNLSEANDLTLRALGAALERRDDETGGHTQRVVQLSGRLAQALGWDEEQGRALRWGAYLHDLGKIAIPDRILHKRGPLDPEERQLIQRHTTAGYEMLQDLHFLPAETLDLVRYHHERWDGTGYPAGLRGTRIPESARIFSIIDVYDALTNARPYKPAWSRERALQEIRAGAGTHFDPEYVKVFLQLLEEEDDARLVL
ncbi:HDIG domain-containing protein [Deinococcus reticulitermitis]|uniref:HDIG domain-containing protein n=1 Tax=Deinococcus reticulitermitis TaxID=856736 RepID=A0A1H6U071_9DEIO|nr:HDIG domain-containing protein [Deinococcus reticulitermitis]